MLSQSCLKKGKARARRRLYNVYVKQNGFQYQLQKAAQLVETCVCAWESACIWVSISLIKFFIQLYILLQWVRALGSLPLNLSLSHILNLHRGFDITRGLLELGRLRRYHPVVGHKVVYMRIWQFDFLYWCFTTPSIWLNP